MRKLQGITLPLEHGRHTLQVDQQFVPLAVHVVNGIGWTIAPEQMLVAPTHNLMVLGLTFGQVDPKLIERSFWVAIANRPIDFRSDESHYFVGSTMLRDVRGLGHGLVAVFQLEKR